MKCDRCKAEFKADWQVHYEIRGYEQAREKGGTNHIEARRRTGRVICNGCLVEVKSKIHKNQLKLTA